MKRGMSGIIVTVLLVVLSLAGVVVMWNVVAPIVSQIGESRTECLFTSLEIVSCSSDDGNTRVLVKRGTDSSNLTGILFLFSGGEISEEIEGAPLILETREYYFTESYDSVAVAGISFGKVCGSESEVVSCAESEDDSDENPGGVDELSYECFDQENPSGATIGADFDLDGVLDSADNCPYNSNSEQEDGNGNGVGDACEHAPGNCGNYAGEIVECFCGDVVAKNFTMILNLRNSTGGFGCPRTGLTLGIDTNLVMLNCNAKGICGSGVNSGLDFNDTNAKHFADNCKIHNFFNGVLAPESAQHARGNKPVVDIRNSEVWNNNNAGIVTIAGGYFNVVNCLIHDNGGYGILTDETIRGTIKNNHIFNNSHAGIGILCRTPWTVTDLDRLEVDNFNIQGNLIEGNGFGNPVPLSGYGFSMSACDHSNVTNNIIKNNAVGVSITLGRQIYREIGKPSTYGRDRSNFLNISNNNIYDNFFQEVSIKFTDSEIDWGGPHFAPFINYFENNRINGRGLEYYYGVNNLRLSGKDLWGVICFGCENVSIVDSNITEMYFAFSNDSDIEYDVERINSDGAYYSIYKHRSNGIGFNNFFYKRIRSEQPITEISSFGNSFSDTVVHVQGDDCLDSDGDGYGVAPRFGLAHECRFIAEDCDDSDSAINPGARELFDGIDNDCDGLIDLQDVSLFFGSCLLDLDHDGFVRLADAIFISSHQGGGCGFYGDLVTDWCYFSDIDRNGITNSSDIDLAVKVITSGPGGLCDCSLGPELCDGYDNDCDGEIDEGC